MMTNTKWLRRALLGGVALSVMATGAQADELTELKSQLEALQSRVNQLEEQPQQSAALPEGASFLTLNRGSASIPTHVDRSHRLREEMPADRGFTIAVTPAADLPAPVAEVVVYGFVKGDVIWDFDQDLGDTFFVPGLLSRRGVDDDVHLRMHAKQTRFGIRSRTDTAIGQIRTQVEGDFFQVDSVLGVNNLFRLRHAFGEWDMTPNWTLLVGQTTRTAVLTPIGVATVDFGYSAGTGGFPRATQVRLTYHAGPISWAVAAEKPTSAYTDTAWPDLSAYVQYDIPGGHEFIVTGTIGDGGDDRFLVFNPGPDPFIVRHDKDITWAVQAGANVNLADIATLTVGALYGEGDAPCAYLIQDTGCGGFLDPIHLNPIFGPGFETFGHDTAWGLTAGLSFNVTETTTFNVQYGFVRSENALHGAFRREFGVNVADHIDTHTVHANILWQPVAQMRLGWEVMWGRVDVDGINHRGRIDDSNLRRVFRDRSEDAIRGQFGAWFFF